MPASGPKVPDWLSAATGCGRRRRPHPPYGGREDNGLSFELPGQNFPGYFLCSSGSPRPSPAIPGHEPTLDRVFGRRHSAPGGPEPGTDRCVAAGQGRYKCPGRAVHGKFHKNIGGVIDGKQFPVLQPLDIGSPGEDFHAGIKVSSIFSESRSQRNCSSALK